MIVVAIVSRFLSSSSFLHGSVKSFGLSPLGQRQYFELASRPDLLGEDFNVHPLDLISMLVSMVRSVQKVHGPGEVHKRSVSRKVCTYLDFCSL